MSLVLQMAGGRLREYVRLVRLDRPIGILLLVWPMLWALWIAAEGVPSPLVLAVFLLGAVLMRSAGCAINDFADRDFDGHVWRTAQRPLAAGTITPREAVVVAAVLALLSFVLVLSMNRLTIQLSFGGVVLAALYPFMKRYTHLPQAFLGIAFSWAVPMAFAAQSGEVPFASWLVFLASMVWALAYDTMYAMADREDDLKIGVKSSAILFGRFDRLVIALLQLIVLGLLILTGLSFHLGFWYFAGLAVASGFTLYQQQMIRARDPRRAFEAFLNNNWFGMVVFVGIVLDYLLR